MPEDGARSPVSAASKLDFPAPLRPMTATTSPRLQRQVDAAKRGYGAVRHDEPASPREFRVKRLDDFSAGVRSASRRRRRVRASSRIAYGQRQRGQSRDPAELDYGRRDRRHRHDLGGVTNDERGAGAAEEDDTVGVLHHTLQPMLGQQHRHAQVVDEPLQCGQHLLGGLRVQR